MRVKTDGIISVGFSMKVRTMIKEMKKNIDIRNLFIRCDYYIFGALVVS